MNIKPPFLGTKTIRNINLNEILKHLNHNLVISFSWGIKGKLKTTLGENWLRKWVYYVKRNKTFNPIILYGYFHYKKKAENIIVENSNKYVKFHFPRSKGSEKISVADYFDKEGIVPFQIVTLGRKPVLVYERLHKRGKYTDAFFLHGLATQTTEALAEYSHIRIRKELGIKQIKGIRYSWGYPSCPDLKQHKNVWKILKPEKIKLKLTKGFQINPEYSTTAVIVFNKEARYFNLKI